jgi:hypothetical protein
MIIWDKGDPYAVCVRGKCSLCRGRLRFPFVVWIGSSREENPDGWIEDATAFICDECCADMCRGFSSDMRQIVTAKQIERLGFHSYAARRSAVSGGLLYGAETGKQ